jgi:hypothetical protein
MTHRFRTLMAAAIAAAAIPTVAMAQTKADLHDAMRRLWTDHVAWTRMYIVSAAANNPDKDATTARLLQNQTDMGNAVAPYYGAAAGSQLTALLRTHILEAADLVAAAKAGNAAAVDSINKKWHGNATDIAMFLSKANPKNWPEATVQSAMFTHLDQTVSEATHQLKGDFAGSARDYDMIETHILALADMLTDGIVKQFPQKFTGMKAK